MKTLFIFFLISKAISREIPEIKSDSLKTLNSSTNEDYFYFVANSKESNHLVLIDNNYTLNQIYYCTARSYYIPTESTIHGCYFYSLDHYGYFSNKSSSDIEYYYKIHAQSDYDMIVVRYSGKNSDGMIKASIALPHISNIEVGSAEERMIRAPYSRFEEYFYTTISNPPSNYVYFNLTDTSNNLDRIIYCCFTQDDPDKYYLKAVRSCNFSSLDFYNSTINNGNHEYYYKLYTHQYSASYVIVKYNYLASSYGQLYAKSSYYEFKKNEKSETLSTVAIVFIVIAGVVVLGFIIGIIFYFYKKRLAKTNPDDVVDKTSNCPLVEQNN